VHNITKLLIEPIAYPIKSITDRWLESSGEPHYRNRPEKTASDHKRPDR